MHVKYVIICEVVGFCGPCHGFLGWPGVAASKFSLLTFQPSYCGFHQSECCVVCCHVALYTCSCSSPGVACSDWLALLARFWPMRAYWNFFAICDEENLNLTILMYRIQFPVMLTIKMMQQTLKHRKFIRVYNV